MIYYRHKKTAELMHEVEFEDKYIMPKAEEYFTYDDILMDFMNKSTKSYLPDWNELKKAFWEYCYNDSLDTLLYEWEKIEITDFPRAVDNDEIGIEDVPLEM